MKPRVLAILLVLVCASAFSGPVKTVEQATTLAIGAIRKFQLTALRADCGVIDAVERETFYEFIVRERHLQNCGGTSETGPRLFSVRVRKRDGRLTSDVYDGVSFQPVDHKPQQAK